jgi:hypothetical protein
MNAVLALLAGALMTAEPPPCVAEVQQMEHQFHALYAAPPVKPGQALLIGRDGQILDAAAYRKRLALLVAARKACAAEREAAGAS